MSGSGPREAILAAAQRLFAEKGYDSVSTAEVCRAAKVSNGSMFHFFPTKDALLGTLYVNALQRYQRAALTGLERSSSARAGIRGFVLRHVRWVVANPELARLIHERRHSEPDRGVNDQVVALNQALVQRVSDWLEPHIRAGKVQRLEPYVFLAVVFGPVYALTRAALVDRDFRRLRAATEALADAAWAAVSASTTAPRRLRARHDS